MAKVIKRRSEPGPAQAKATLLNLRDIAAETQRTVLHARKEAARILERARGDAEATRRQAAEAGYEEGLARGRHDGYEQGRQEALAEARQKLSADASSLVELAGKVVGELGDARDTVLLQGREEALQFALELAERIVGRVATSDIETARQNLAKAMERAGCSGEVTVQVNPRQLEALRMYCAELTDTLGMRGGVRLVGDERVAPGGVHALTTVGQIDATIRKQLDNVAEALLGPSGGPGRVPPGAKAGKHYLPAKPVPQDHESA
jgi:flagellar assembly protein FliH